MSRISRLGHALYEGQVSIDFVGRKYLWYAISGLILVVSLFGLFVVQLNMGIEFEGGVEYRVAVDEPTQDDVDTIINAVGDITNILNIGGDGGGDGGDGGGVGPINIEIGDVTNVIGDVVNMGGGVVNIGGDILNIGGFNDAVFNVVAAFLADDASRFVAEVESIEL